MLNAKTGAVCDYCHIAGFPFVIHFRRGVWENESGAEKMSLNPSVSGFVLAGGRSSRMGGDKARLEIGDQPLLLRAVNLLKAYMSSVAILGPAGLYEFIYDPVIPDLWPGEGPLAAILTALEHSDSEWNIFLACDLPLVTDRFIDLLIRCVMISDADAVVPRTADGWQPLSAAYHVRCRTAFAQAIKEGRRSIVGLLEEIRVRVITQSDIVNAGLSNSEFANMNTPEDWGRIIELLKERDESC
jgi:molybdopterin-guanine dinucleotide biosynthesis protein A